ncbi:3 exoribonuclease family protein [Zalerion maritima]|uniref:3 exoribonuclease family protein n=1 Tax=Zalerion maritima TaxID=339359 RepID=A0AAD5RM37_9PEZI|nr:3 exoribonuclease family protein [Zalerion maritima]
MARGRRARGSKGKLRAQKTVQPAIPGAPEDAAPYAALDISSNPVKDSPTADGGIYDNPDYYDPNEFKPSRLSLEESRNNVQRDKDQDKTTTTEPPTSPPPKPQNPFPFLKLPLDLRLMVYSHYFSDISERVIDVSPRDNRLIHHRLHPLLRASKLVYCEASHHFYSTHIFRLFPTDPMRFNMRKKPLVARLKPHQRLSVTTLEMRMGPGWGKPPRSWAVNKRLKLHECENVRKLHVLVQCDPSDEIFDGFRRADGFYEEFCQKLLDEVLKALPAVQIVQFDAWSSVRKRGDMMNALLEAARENGRRITWGPLRGWTDVDVDEDFPGFKKEDTEASGKSVGDSTRGQGQRQGNGQQALLEQTQHYQHLLQEVTLAPPEIGAAA